ncbi:MAG: GntR family transcriptional regulator, partial [Pseudomonadota bacterium]
RRLGGISAAVEEIWLDAALAPDLVAEHLVESLYLYYRETLDIWIQRVEDRIGMGAAPAWTTLFQGQMGLVDRISWDQTGRRVEVSRTWFDPSHVRYVSRQTWESM